jgi:NAD(P)-dependent dehydrogenase (short-subunit alcohol dehydrogenase family)
MAPLLVTQDPDRTPRISRASRRIMDLQISKTRETAMGEFDSKVVVVTGGSRGIGRAIAAAFAREGAQTVLAASSAQNLAAVTKAIGEGSGPRVLEPVTVAADLRELVGCEAVAAAVHERCKRCDILVNNAGATQAGNFLNLPDSAWIDGYALKLFGCVRMTRLLWPMLKEAQGHVVNIIGIAARLPSWARPLEKFAIAALTEPPIRKSGPRVLCLSLGGWDRLVKCENTQNCLRKLISGCTRRCRPVRVIAQGWSTYVDEILVAVMRYLCVACDMGRIRTFR